MNLSAEERYDFAHQLLDSLGEAMSPEERADWDESERRTDEAPQRRQASHCGDARGTRSTARVPRAGDVVMTARLIGLAWSDVVDADEWYDVQSNGLGDRFLDAIDSLVDGLAA